MQGLGCHTALQNSTVWCAATTQGQWGHGTSHEQQKGIVGNHRCKVPTNVGSSTYPYHHAADDALQQTVVMQVNKK